MKKLSIVFKTCAFIGIGLALFACKGKENNAEKKEIVQEEETIIEDDSITPITLKFSDNIIDGFYENNELCDTMYVSATSGLRVRRGPSTDEETIGKLPYRFAAKIVAVGEKTSVGDIQSYWVKVVMPDYSEKVTEPNYGWVFGGYLSKEIPEIKKPESGDELAAYICSNSFYMRMQNKSTFEEDGYTFCFYHDGTFYCCRFEGECEITKEGKGTWKADSSTHITVESEDISLDGFYVHKITEEGFSSPYEDDPYGWEKFSASIGYLDFVKEKMVSEYKYSYSVYDDDGVKKINTFFESYINYFEGERLNSMIVSGVNMAGTKYESNYNEYWDPIRKKEAVQSLELVKDKDSVAISGEWFSAHSFDAGSFIIPKENVNEPIYSIPLADEKYKIGTFSSGDVGVLKQVAVYNDSIPVPDDFLNIIDTTNGISGWVYFDLDDSMYLSTIDMREGDKKLDRVNAKVDISEKTFDVSRKKIVHPVMSHNGNFYATIGDGQIVYVPVGDYKFSGRENQDYYMILMGYPFDESSVMAFDEKDENIFAVTSYGKILKVEAEGKERFKQCGEVSFEHADFSYPTDLFVSPDNTHLFIKGIKNGGEKTPVLVVYAINSEGGGETFELNLRSEDESFTSESFFSDVSFNSKGEALYTTNQGGGLLVKVSYDENGKPVTETIKIGQELASLTPMFGPDEKGYILAGGKSNRLVRLSSKGKILKQIYGLVHDDETESKVYEMGDKSTFAVVSKCCYDKTYYKDIVTIYSKKTLNVLYSACNELNSETVCFMSDNSFVSISEESHKGKQIKFYNINEKEKQLRLTPLFDEKTEKICKTDFYIVMPYENLMNVHFTPNGKYRITVYSNVDVNPMEREDVEIGSLCGVYEWKSDSRILLNNAIESFGRFNSVETGEMGPMSGYLRNIPIIERGGTMEMMYEEPSEIYINGRMTCDYCDK
ncbi:MAG: SH3 domain-containing protein [Treponema sp.]|nr:SH3 domain-containing protein [Candidatus Treponema merdequi]